MRLDSTDVANLRAAGLTVVELPGWLTRGRPGAHDPNGILCHHTAAAQDGRAYADWMALEGRADLSAPLAQIGLARTGVVYMQAAGRANHAGRCKIVRPWLTPYAGRDYGDGNAQLIGIEAMNTGTEGWSATQKRAYVVLCAVLCARRGWDSQHVLGHKETSLEGKPDPSFDMTTHRDQVAAVLTEETDMPLTEDDARTVLTGSAVLKNPFAANPDTAPRVAASFVLEQTAATVKAAKADTTAIAKKLAELTSHVEAIAPATPVSDEQLERVLRKVIGSVDNPGA